MLDTDSPVKYTCVCILVSPLPRDGAPSHVAPHCNAPSLQPSSSRRLVLIECCSPYFGPSLPVVSARQHNLPNTAHDGGYHVGTSSGRSASHDGPAGSSSAAAVAVPLGTASLESPSAADVSPVVAPLPFATPADASAVAAAWACVTSCAWAAPTSTPAPAPAPAPGLDEVPVSAGMSSAAAARRVTCTRSTHNRKNVSG